ncbi:hypothetical protein BKA70DRAFT_1270893 [Coprinopsis sp. MPI-PUGE-AT-0042]|nr:hypothetical protein BKA70DRAFT_1270893 [Coprinopsis sp. MPI-PUGE-AT-0042]
MNPVYYTSNYGASASTLNIPIADPSDNQGQSSHSYLKELNQPKKKVKSRSDCASIFSNSSVKSKKGVFKSATRTPRTPGSQGLGKKAIESMHKLLKTSEEAGKAPSPMKWETFLKALS